MTGSRGGVVVCGADGSVGARHALARAVRSAASRGARLRVVAAFDPPDRSFGWTVGGGVGIPIPSTTEVAAAIRADVADTLDDVLDELAAEIPVSPELDIVVEVGPPSSVLLAESMDAVELVVGHRGHGVVSALGSVALACLLHASCPVTVVPEPASRAATITVEAPAAARA
ncbi:MAG TPA: universal stress protein [Actinomycetospora sp.]|uniref:universal stress protein n=1 Tax=Actinomycetospora sp. TaxID=1872135 RepID=UPI002F3E5F93